MMTDYVKLGNKEYPIKFSHTALVRFAGKENIPFMKLEEEFKRFEEWNPERLFNLIYFGLKEGARLEKVPFNLSLDDVIDLSLSNQDSVLQQIFGIVTKSMPQESKKNEPPTEPEMIHTRT